MGAAAGSTNKSGMPGKPHRKHSLSGGMHRRKGHKPRRQPKHLCDALLSLLQLPIRNAFLSPGACAHLLAGLHADLAPEHAREEAHVEGQHVQPDGVVQGGALREVGHVGGDALVEHAQQGVAAKGGGGAASGDEPAAAAAANGTSERQGHGLFPEGLAEVVQGTADSPGSTGFETPAPGGRISCGLTAQLLGIQNSRSPWPALACEGPLPCPTPCQVPATPCRCHVLPCPAMRPTFQGGAALHPHNSPQDAGANGHGVLLQPLIGLGSLHAHGGAGLAGGAGARRDAGAREACTQRHPKAAGELRSVIAL